MKGFPMKRIAFVLLLTLSFAAFAGYKHAANLTSSGTSVSTTLSPVPADGRIALQCHGGDGRFAFGTGSATAVNTQGLRVIADTAPEPVTLFPGQDTVAMIVDSNSSGTVVCTVLYASK